MSANNKHEGQKNGHGNGHAHGHNEDYRIVVNGKPVTFSKKRISYEDVVVLAFGSYSPSDSVSYTVAYFKGHNMKEGTLVSGQSVRVKEGMVFNVGNANKA